MVVGMCRVVLSLPGNDSLKGKRSVVKSVLERTRARFHVTAAEVADMDNHRRATLGFAVVSNDARHARSVLDKLVGFVAAAGPGAGHRPRRECGALRAGAPGSAHSAASRQSWEDDDGDDEEG